MYPKSNENMLIGDFIEVDMSLKTLYINTLKTIDLGVYRNFKGQYYQVIDLAKKATNGTDGYDVYYRALYDGDETYTRDVDEFISEVDFEKYPLSPQPYRFERLKFENAVKIPDDILAGKELL